MMKDGDDFNHPWLHTIEHTVGKVEENRAPEARPYFWVQCRMCSNPSDRGVN